MTEAKENILDPKPGEIKVYISAWLFLDSKRFTDVFESWTHLDGMIELTRILTESKAIKRAIVSKHAFYNPKLEK